MTGFWDFFYGRVHSTPNPVFRLRELEKFDPAIWRSLVERRILARAPTPAEIHHENARWLDVRKSGDLIFGVDNSDELPVVVNPPGPEEDLFEPKLPAKQAGTEPANSKSRPCTHSVRAASESTESLLNRQRESAARLKRLVAETDLTTHDLVWEGGDCPECRDLNGTAYGKGWTTPPPLHHNCDCEIVVRQKAETPNRS